jgi:hypothetical protein
MEMAKKGFASSQRNGGDKVGKCRWGRQLCWRRVEWQVVGSAGRGGVR